MEKHANRALTVPGLPYRIHYVIVGDVVTILSIAHTRRKPRMRF